VRACVPGDTAIVPKGALRKDEYWSYMLMVLKVPQVTACTFCLAE
jgi:hypothetical protein